MLTSNVHGDACAFERGCAYVCVKVRARVYRRVGVCVDVSMHTPACPCASPTMRTSHSISSQCPTCKCSGNCKRQEELHNLGCLSLTVDAWLHTNKLFCHVCMLGTCPFETTCPHPHTRTLHGHLAIFAWCMKPRYRTSPAGQPALNKTLQDECASRPFRKWQPHQRRPFDPRQNARHTQTI